MKKFLFAAVAVLTISASAYFYTQRQNTLALNDLAMANIEALASGESTQCWISTVTWICGTGGMSACSPCGNW